MRRLVSGKALRRFAAAAIGIFILGLATSPVTQPARGAGATSIAVNAFENEAGAPANVVSDLSNAAYRAVAATGRFTAKGSGPMPIPGTLTSDPFISALDAAGKAGADDVLLGSVIQAGGGQVYYRLSLYRVVPTAFIGSQVFSQAYPPADGNALTAGIANNINTLAAPRQAVGTIYSTAEGPKSDTGSSEGFQLGDRFNVMRGGQKVAEATISSIRDDEASLSISNAVSGYTPMVGDTLVGLRPLGPVEPAPGERSSFSALGFLVAIGGALLAIGHHGQPGAFTGVSGTPGPTASPFTVQPQTAIENLPQVTFPFIFTNPLSATSINNIPAQTSYVTVNTQLPGSNATSPPQSLVSFCNCQVQFSNTTSPGGSPETLMQFTATNLVANELIFFDFTSAITDQFGNTLAQPALFEAGPLARVHHGIIVKPGGRTPAPKPGSTAKPIPLPAPRPPVNPKPPPDGPKTPH